MAAWHVRWVEGLGVDVAEPEEMALLCIRATVSVWQQSAGNRAEPMAHAFRRLFGYEMPPIPFLLAVVFHEDRFKTVHAYPGGFIAVRDPARGGWELRTFTRAAKAKLEAVHNVCERLERKDSRQRPYDRIGSAGLAWSRSAAKNL